MFLEAHRSCDEEVTRYFIQFSNMMADINL